MHFVTPTLILNDAFFQAVWGIHKCTQFQTLNHEIVIVMYF